MPLAPDFIRLIRDEACRLGFDAVGFAPADQPLERDYQAYRRFVAAGMHGEMGYLADHAQVRERLDGDGMLPGAKTVICLARSYARDTGSDSPFAGTIARYARGRDYHGFLRRRLRRLAVFVRGLSDGVQARVMVDTAPVLERAWAARAGLGFVGKNGLLIVPGQGSYCLLGEVLTTLPVGAVGNQPQERCGSCTACLDACPTDAFAEPFVLDPRRCISYWTIESRELPPPELEQAVAEHLFGCDVCQQVCPYNVAAVAGDSSPFEPHERWQSCSLEHLVRLDEDGYHELTEGSPTRRATRFGLARNALLMAAARGDEAATKAALEHDDARLRALADRLSRCAKQEDA